MLDTFKTHLASGVRALSDMRTLGQLGFVVIVLLVSWSGVKAIQTNYELQKKIAQTQQQVAIAELENQNLALQNEYLQTDQFLELAVRQQFGKAARDEKIYVVPQNVALSYAPKISIAPDEETITTQKPAYQQNLEAWITFFFRKSDTKLLQSAQ